MAILIFLLAINDESESIGKNWLVHLYLAFGMVIS